MKLFRFTLPLPADSFDVVLIVGALSVGQVPVGVVRELCKSAKPGENFVFGLMLPQLQVRDLCESVSHHYTAGAF